MTQDNTILEYLNIILNSISFFGGLIVLSILLILTLTNPQPMNRVSIRLTGFISFIDLLKALTILVYTYTTSKGIACSIIGFLLNYFTLLYLFSTVAIAVNLNLVVILGKEFKKEWEFWYWICPIFGALILAMLPFGKEFF